MQSLGNLADIRPENYRNNENAGLMEVRMFTYYNIIIYFTMKDFRENFG